MKEKKIKNASFKSRSDKRLGWLLNTPYLVFTFIFFLIPLGWAAWLSVMDWNLMSPDREFVGIQNFIDLFSDDKVMAAFWNSLRYFVPIVILCFLIGLGIALLIDKMPEKVRGFTAVLFLIPYLTSGVATAVFVRFIFSYNSVLNVFLRDSFNLDIAWFQNADTAFAIMVGLVVWKMSGYYALFILSAIESVPKEVNESAMLDGSVGSHRLAHITLPMIMPTLTTVIVLATGLSFGIYTEPFLLTGGGPNLATTTWQLEIYNSAFTQFKSGYAAAMAIMNAIQIFVVLRIIQYITNRFNKRFGW